jgi:hypothetical protein
VSLILDALRKLERDKEPRDPGVVVVGGVPWGGRDPGHRGRSLAVAGILVVAAVAGSAWLWSRAHVSAPSGAVVTPAGPPAEAAAPPPDAPATPADTPGVAPARAEAPAAIVAPAGPAPAAGAPTTDEPPAARPLDLPVSVETAAAAAEPARETAPARPAPRRLVLTAISERDGRPVALLNDHLVHEGDSFDGVRVLRIRPTEVEVEVDGKTQVVGF